jgi:hypothetical protein
VSRLTDLLHDIDDIVTTQLTHGSGCSSRRKQSCGCPRPCDCGLSALRELLAAHRTSPYEPAKKRTFGDVLSETLARGGMNLVLKRAKRAETPREMG